MSMEPRRLRTAIVAFALALFLAACGGSSSDQATTADAVDVEPVVALSGDFPTVSGAGIDLNSLEGQDVVLWFWAPW